MLGWETDPPRSPPNVQSDSGRVSVIFSQDFFRVENKNPVGNMGMVKIYLHEWLTFMVIA